MLRLFRRVAMVGTLLMLAACSDANRDPTAPAAPDKPDFLSLTPYPADMVWDMATVEATYGSASSLDDSPEGQALPVYSQSDPMGETVVCRDHTKPIDLWWNSPNDNGVVTFHLNPPLRLRGFNGYYTDPSRFRWRTAVYSVDQSSEAMDNAGNVWRFSGRFNALCRQGQTRVGFLHFDAQIVVSRGPIDPPVLVRRGTTSGTGGGCSKEYTLQYDPYAPYSPDDCDGMEGGSGGGGDSGGGGGGGCTPQYVVMEVSYDGGETWSVYWAGTATVCG